MQEPKIILALDYGTEDSMLALVSQLDPSQCKLKVGKGLFTRYGPHLVRQLVAQKFDVFLDLKFHDIPSTVAQACQAAADLGVWMLNVHALGGEAMLTAALEAIQPYGHNKPKLIAVTVLTSMDDRGLAQVGVHQTVVQQVNHLAQLTAHAGLDGVVCSAHEIQALRQSLGQAFCLVTPGIRLQTGTRDDQQRVMTPKQAIISGSNYLVIGRQITKADNPLAMLQQINLDIGSEDMS